MRVLIGLVLLTLAGCASTPPSLDSIRPGMDKDEVLREVGNPKRTFRANTQDHWIYVYFEGDQEFARQIDFAQSKVIKVGRPVPKQSLERALENAESMEEFEAKAREQQRKNSKFKNIDGG